MVGFVLEAISALYILGGRLLHMLHMLHMQDFIGFHRICEDSWCPSGAERIARASFPDSTGCRPLRP